MTRRHNFGRALRRKIWRQRLATFLSLAMLLLVPATLPAVCRPVAATCTNGCCTADVALTAGSAVAMHCCQGVNSNSQFSFVSPDLAQFAVAPLIQLAPPQIVQSFYEVQRASRGLSTFDQPITPQPDPLLKTTELLI